MIYYEQPKEHISRKLLVACILGGWFGLHKFMQKKIFSGILYLFTFGLFFVGWFKDIKSFTDTIQLQNQHNAYVLEEMEREAEEKKRRQEREAARKRVIQRKMEETNSKISAIPSCDINFDLDNKLSRNTVSSFPEIKLAPVGKKFDTTKISSFVVVDIETTGLSAAKDRICQLSAILYVDGEPVQSFNTFINPKKNISLEASKINGITDEMLESAPTLEEVANSFLQFIGNRPIVGYNLVFDLKFLYCSGIDIFNKRKFYDAYILAKKVYSTYDYKLVTVANDIGIYYDAHNSLADCWAAGCVFLDEVQTITNP